MYVYIQTERNPALYTVGFYKPDGKFESDSDWSEQHMARQAVHFLNGGIGPDVADSIKDAATSIIAIEARG